MLDENDLLLAGDLPVDPLEDVEPFLDGPGDAETPLVLKVPGSGILYVRTSADDWVASDPQLVRAELERHHPGVCASEDGKPMGVPTLLERYGRRCDRVVYDMTRQTSTFTPSPDGGGELLIGCGRRPFVPPVYSAEVDQWLRLLAPPEYVDKMLDWLATATDLTWPSACLYLYGPRSAGKGLLAAGVARLWGRAVTGYRDIVGEWNSALRECPVVLLDEGCTPPPDGSASLRSLTGEVQRPLLEKYRPAATLLGAVRVIVAANNLDALHLDDVRTADDEEAIGERVLMISIPRSSPRTSLAGDYLESIGGRTRTLGWVSDPRTGEPGALTRHLAWLVEHRKVQRGSRFAVHGEAGEWMRGAGLRAGLAQDVLIALIHAIEGERGTWHESCAPAWASNGKVLVNTSRLHDRWEQLTHSRRRPNEKRIGQALNALSVGSSRTAPTCGAPRVRVHHIPGIELLKVSEALGIGDPDRLREALGLPANPHPQREVA